MSFINLPNVLLDVARNPVTALGIPLVVGTLSGLPTSRVVKGYWYQNLYVPPGRPPRWAFPVVWTSLYLSMGYASHLAVGILDNSVSPSVQETVLTGLKVYYGQLVLNWIWTPLFFGSKKTGYALVDIVALWASVVYLTRKLHGPTDGVSTYFLGPYCVWLSLATYLNGGIWYLNRGRPLPKRD